MKLYLLLFALVLPAESQTESSKIALGQLEAFKRLLKNSASNILTTCNIVFFKDMVDYNEADRQCKSFDIGSGRAEEGNLVTVNNDKKNNDLKLLLEMAYPKKEQGRDKWGPTRWVWAGLRKVRNNNKKKAGPYDTADWEWADKSSPTEFAEWLPRQPDQNNLKLGKKGCDEDPICFQNQMRINHEGKWDDTYKFMKHPFACDYQGKYVISSQMKSWNEAKAMCERAGLHLAIIRNAQERQEIESAMTHFLGPGDPNWRR